MCGAATKSLRSALTVVVLLAACVVSQLLTACGGSRVGAASSPDARTPVHLSAKEREHLRSGMRIYLESMHGIIEALAESKMSAVAQNARKAGIEALRDVPLWSAIKLPPEFVLLGMDTHQKFDDLSRAASRMGNRKEVLQQLRDILANCTGCHATYRLSPE
jgi:hypothetical protein